jgi:hypothetical protein
VDLLYHLLEQISDGKSVRVEESALHVRCGAVNFNANGYLKSQRRSKGWKSEQDWLEVRHESLQEMPIQVVTSGL